jgi:hypothetical protein
MLFERAAGYWRFPRSGRSLNWIKVKNPDAPAATRLIEG